MRRLYYLVADLPSTREISERLHQEGISDWNFHVLAKDPSGLYSHHIQSALPHHHKDLIRTGEIGALYGGLVSAILAWGLLAAGIWSSTSGLADVGALTLAGILVGGVWGLRLGLKREHHRLSSFNHDIDAGQYLIMVDVRKEDKAKIRELMNMEFANADYRGNDSTFVRPFKTADRVYPNPTHKQPPAELGDGLVD